MVRVWSGPTDGSASLKALAIRGSAWTLVGYGASMVLRLGSNIALAWLLFPEAFGLMALIAVVLGGMRMLSDVGLAPSVIQSRRGQDPAFLNTVWTIQVVRGFALWVIVCLLAWPVATLYSMNDPSASQLLYLLPVAGFGAVIRGFYSPGLMTLSRSLQIGRLTAYEFTVAVVSSITMIVWALIHPSVWALVGGSLIGGVVKILLSYRIAPEVSVRFQWDRDSLREIFGFGKWIFVSTIITFLAMNADRLMLGGLVSIEMLGIYGFGVILASLPKEVLSKLISGVLFPVLAEQNRRDPRSLARKVEQARSHVLPVAMFMVLGVVMLAPTFFELLYDSRYYDAGWMAQLFAVGVWFSLVGETSSRVLLATGRSRNLAGSNFANLAVTAAGCMGGYWLFGMPGFIAGYALGNVAGLIVFQATMHRIGMPVVVQDLRFSVLLGILAGGGLLLMDVASHIRPAVVPAVWWQAATAAVVLAIIGMWTLRRSLPLVWPR